jgi:hypothetical protein
MNKFTKLSGSALCAALLSGSSDIAAHAQNALTTVSSQNMSEATIVRVGCGIGDPSFIEATVINSAAQSAPNFFTMPTMVGLLEPARSKTVKSLKNSMKLLFHFNTCCLMASALIYGPSLMTLTAVAISLWMTRRFWTEFAMCISGRQALVQTKLFGASNEDMKNTASSKSGCSASENAVRRVVRRMPVSANAITVSESLPVVATTTVAEPSWYDRPDPTPEEMAHFIVALDRAFESTSSEDKSERAELVCHSR